MPLKDLSELIAWLKANPNKASVAGTNTGVRLLATLFSEGNRDAIYSRALSDLARRSAGLGCRSDRPLLGTPDQLPLLRAGNIKAYALSSDRRWVVAPDIPTFAEMGLPALSSIGSGFSRPEARRPTLLAN